MEVLTKGLDLQSMLQIIVVNVIAFVLLVWLLKKYAWGPIMGVLDDRAAKIKGDYAAAAGKLGEAEQLRQGYDAKLAEIKALERERVQEAVKRGEEIAQRLEKEARAKAGDFMTKAEAELDREVGTAREHLREEVVIMALSAAERVVKEKLDDAKHRALVEDFIQQLGDVRG